VPHGVEKAVRYLLSSANPRLQKASLMSSLEKYLHSDARWRTSSSRGPVCWIAEETLFNGVKSMTNRSLPPSGLGTNMGVQAFSAAERLIRPSFSFVSTNWKSLAKEAAFSRRCLACHAAGWVMLIFTRTRWSGPFTLFAGASRSGIPKSEKLFVISDGGVAQVRIRGAVVADQLPSYLWLESG
jgi:hypothetical protein